MAKKLRVTTLNKPSIVINRTRATKNTLVYIAVSNKAFNYRFGKSRVVYIGTTKTGTYRIAQSAVDKSKDLFTLHGIKQLSFYIVTCSSVKNLQSWKKLERALILTFRQLYGDPPKENIQGKRMKLTDEYDYFSRAKLLKVIEKYSN